MNQGSDDMKIAIIGSRKSEESQLLKEQAQKRNHQAEIIPLIDLIFKGHKEFSIIWQGQDISFFDIVLFRAIDKHPTEARIAAKYMNDKGKVVVDEILAKGSYKDTKLFSCLKLLKSGLPYPLTYQALSLEKIKEILGQIKTPIIIKNVDSMRGKDVFRFDKKEKALDFFSQKKKYHYLIQEWLSAQKYYRVFVVGNKVFGAMERLALKCKNRPDIPLEQKAKKTKLTPGLESLALRAAITAQIEIAGVDIMQGKILEVNRSPRFMRFMQVTDINVAKKIIIYLEEKYAKL